MLVIVVKSVFIVVAKTADFLSEKFPPEASSALIVALRVFSPCGMAVVFFSFFSFHLLSPKTGYRLQNL